MKSDKHQLLTRTYTKLNIRWLVHNWSTFGAKMSHGKTWAHKSHHGLDLWGSHHLPLYIILCASPWGPHPNGILSWDSQMGISKFPKLGLPWLWGPITLCVDLRLGWGLKQSCSPYWELSNGRSHATYMQENRVHSWLLVVGNQITNLTLDPSFGHNLCFRFEMGHVNPF
jgi:hypothetical protein